MPQRSGTCPIRVAVGVLAFVYLMPSAAMAQPARLSADLADLLAAGAPSIDIIVHGSEADVNALAARHGASLLKYLSTGAVLRVSAGQLAAIQVDGTQDHLSSDGAIRSAATVAAQTILADPVWTGGGALPALSGAGVGIALIDSGVDAWHETLWDRVAASVDFTGGDGQDRFGHGTHVAALIAGTPAWLADGQEFRGIASGAHIVNLRVLDGNGFGRAGSVIEAIDWAIAYRAVYGIRILNLSLGAPVLQPYRDDPLCEAVERAVAAGILVVTSAGNLGESGFGTITSPANDPGVIAAGALDTQNTPIRADDAVAGFSSRGPSAYDLVAKPDLVAPGTDIVSAEAAGSFLSARYPEARVAGANGDAYMRLSGTSMAAALASGAAALLFEQRPELTAQEVKAILQATSTPTVDGPLVGGAGSLNVLAAATLVAASGDGRQ